MSRDQRNPSTGYIDGITNTTHLESRLSNLKLENYTGKRNVMVVVHISIIVGVRMRARTET